MKKILFCLAALCMTGLSGTVQAADISDQYVDYKLEENRYAVIYVERGDDTDGASAKEMAMRRAAEVTKNNGYSYFQIEKEQKVEVASASSPSNPFGTNIYEEKIIQGDTGTTSFEQRTEPQTGGIYPGYKITFKVFKEKPSGSSYAACDYTDC
jgi:hypothetical protein